MRPLTASAAALLLLAPAARAADLPARVPLYRAAPVHALRPLPPVAVAAVPPLRLECSPTTGQPMTVVYNEPGRTPWSVEPDLALVPLPRAKPFKTRAVYPRGG